MKLNKDRLLKNFISLAAISSPSLKEKQETMKGLGFKPKLCVSGGATDANILYSNGIVTPILSTGIKNVHTNQEYLDLKNFFNCANLTLEILRRA